MPNVHKSRPLSVRLLAGDRERLSAFAEGTGMAPNAHVAIAVSEYLDRHGGTAPVDGGNTTTVVTQPGGTTTKAAPRNKATPVHAPPVAAMPTQADTEPSSGTVPCKHPTASVNDGVCVCGTELDPA